MFSEAQVFSSIEFFNGFQVWELLLTQQAKLTTSTWEDERLDVFAAVASPDA